MTTTEGTYKGVAWYQVGTSWYAVLGDGVVGPNDRHFSTRAAMQRWISENLGCRVGSATTNGACGRKVTNNGQCHRHLEQSREIARLTEAGRKAVSK